MTSVNKTAGAAGSISFTTKNTAGQLITPVSSPVAQWFTDAGRTLGSLTLPVTGSGSSYSATWTAGQAPATPAARYLRFSVETATGVFSIDADDDIQFTAAGVDVNPTYLATLAEFKTAINDTSGSTTNDVEYQSFLDAATAVVENITGPIIPRTVTELHSGGMEYIVLRQRPVISVISLTEYTGTGAQALTLATSLDLSGGLSFTLDRETGTVIRRAAGYGYPFPSGMDNVTVVYSAGYSVVPENIKRAALAQAAHFYQQTQLGGRPAFNGGANSGGAATGFGYGVPYFVRQTLEPNERIPGIG